jgi:hypothetical protein
MPLDRSDASIRVLAEGRRQTAFCPEGGPKRQEPLTIETASVAFERAAPVRSFVRFGGAAVPSGVLHWCSGPIQSLSSALWPRRAAPSAPTDLAMPVGRVP